MSRSTANRSPRAGPPAETNAARLLEARQSETRVEPHWRAAGVGENAQTRLLVHVDRSGIAIVLLEMPGHQRVVGKEAAFEFTDVGQYQRH